MNNLRDCGHHAVKSGANYRPIFFTGVLISMFTNLLNQVRNLYWDKLPIFTQTFIRQKLL